MSRSTFSVLVLLVALLINGAALGQKTKLDRGGNYLKNGGFESSGKGGVPGSWTAGKTVGKNGTVSRSEDKAHTGQFSLWIQPNQRNRSGSLVKEGLGVAQGFPAKAFRGKSIYVSAWLASEGDASAVVGLVAPRKQSGPLIVELKDTKSDAGFTHYEGSLSIPDNDDVKFVVLLCIAQGTGGMVYIDDVRLGTEPERQVAASDTTPVRSRSSRGPETARIPVARATPPASGNANCLDSRVRTADPNAMPDTKRVLAYLMDLPNRKDGRVISGQFVGHGKYSGLDEFETIHAKTGEWPGMIGHDYGLMHSTDTSGNPYLIDYWNNGGLVTVSHHPLNPQKPRFGSTKSKLKNFSELLTPGTKANQNWISDLDVVADGLAQLRDHGVVVLWRPLHEMNKGYFWWGKQVPDEFKAVWRQMFEYFTVEKGLHNLLWVYSPYEEEGTVLTYYPGDEYVDLVALDVYQTDPREMHGYQDLMTLGKPFGFGEYGPSGALLFVVPIVNKNIDYSQLIEAIKEKFPQTVFFQSWGGQWGMHSHRNADKLLQDPWVLNRGELTWRDVCPSE